MTRCWIICKNECKKIAIKRFFLPTLGILALLVFNEIRNFIYLPLFLTYASFILFWNFPKLVYYANAKPLFFEDIFIDTTKLPLYNVSDKIKKKFTAILLWTLIISNSLFVGALSDFWLYKTSDLTGIIEIIGVTGGILKIFQVVNNVIASLLLYIIRHYIIKETEKNKLGINMTPKRKRLKSNNYVNFEAMVNDEPSLTLSTQNTVINIPNTDARNRSPHS